MRRARDPIEHVRTLILEHELAEPGDLKRMEKEIKKVHARRVRQLHVGSYVIKEILVMQCMHHREEKCTASGFFAQIHGVQTADIESLLGQQGPCSLGRLCGLSCQDRSLIRKMLYAGCAATDRGS